MTSLKAVDLMIRSTQGQLDEGPAVVIEAG
jgi:hypothetical protein